MTNDDTMSRRDASYELRGATIRGTATGGPARQSDPTRGAYSTRATSLRRKSTSSPNVLSIRRRSDS
jgi:hypothetical protein